jgi:hypothetical protein
VQQVVLDAQTTVLEVWLGVVVELDVMVVRVAVEMLALPVLDVVVDALVALAVRMDAGQPATAGAHNHAHQDVVTQLELGVYLDK